jgi:hypothetical protein
VFAVIISDKKPKLTIRAPRTNFIIKLLRYAYEWRTLQFMFLFVAIISDKKPKLTIRAPRTNFIILLSPFMRQHANKFDFA